MPNFIDLPQKIRREIYLLAGVPTGEGILLNDPDRVKRFVRFEDSTCDSHTCYWPYILPHGKVSRSLPHDWLEAVISLQLVSKIIQSEEEEIFYSENAFVVHESAPGGLEPLARLGGGALSAMKQLTVGIGYCFSFELFLNPAIIMRRITRQLLRRHN